MGFPSGEILPDLEGESLEELDAQFVEQMKGRKMITGAALDGSLVSEKAVRVCGRLSNKGKTYVLHIADPRKASLPVHLSPQHLENKFDNERAELGMPNGRWMCRDKQIGKSTQECVTELACELGLDMLVVGSFGRKGEKFDVLGSVSDGALRQSLSHVCVVKNTSPPLGDSLLYLFATDDSHAARVAFSILVNQLVRPGDEVRVIHTCMIIEPNTSAVLQPYQELMAAKAVKGSTALVETNGKSSLVSSIIDAASAAEADFIVMGCGGFNSSKLGSVSEGVVVGSRFNAIVLKDPFQLATQFGNMGLKSITDNVLPATQRRLREMREDVE